MDLDPDRALVHLLAKQCLHVRSGAIPEVADRLVGLHATNPTGPYLSLRARMAAFEREQFDGVCYTRWQLARIQCIRTTLFFLTRELIPIAFAATRRLLERYDRPFRELHGLERRTYERHAARILDLLAGRELTARQIKASLSADVDLSAVLQLMCTEGLTVRARPARSWKDRAQTYRVFREVLPGVDLESWEAEDATRELVGRYVRAYGPVTEADIAWWTGLGKAPIRAAVAELGDRLVGVSIAGRDGLHLMDAQDLDRLPDRVVGDPVVAALPSLDPFVMGFKVRDHYLDPQHRPFVYDRSGNATTTLLVGGRIAGVWDLPGGATEVRFLLFDRPEPALRRKVVEECQRVGSFMSGSEVEIRECRYMRPLRERTSGGFLTPLEGASVVQ